MDFEDYTMLVTKPDCCDDGLGCARGILNAILVSIPLWIVAIYFMFF